MASERRFVFDTNSIVSALLLRQSVSRQAFDHARGQGILLVSLDVYKRQPGTFFSVFAPNPLQ